MTILNLTRRVGLGEGANVFLSPLLLLLRKKCLLLSAVAIPQSASTVRGTPTMERETIHRLDYSFEKSPFPNFFEVNPSSLQRSPHPLPTH